ncbi:MAG: N-acetylmuramoyl-L-alanine amidase [Bacillota bacterium]
MFFKKIGTYIIFLAATLLVFFSGNAAAADLQITNIRWSMMPDTDSSRVLRIVLDLNGAYDLRNNIYAQTNKNSTSISGIFKNLTVAPGVAKTVSLSDDIASSVELQSAGSITKLLVSLPNNSDASSLNVFVVKADKVNNKPWRIVVDVIKPIVTSSLTSTLTPTMLKADYGIVQITDIRSSLLPDVNGAQKLRIVFDLSGAYRLNNSLQFDSTVNQLQTLLTNANLIGKTPKQLKFTDSVAKSIELSQIKDSTVKLTVALQQKLQADCYNLFVLPADRANNKPWRLVLDIFKPVPVANLKFSAGLKGKKIAIDPGHGGSDPGAIGLGGTHESDVTLPIALQLKNLLEENGSTVFMSRIDDRDVFAPNADDGDELQARADAANSNKADVFVCIHADSFRDHSVGGTSTFYYPKTNFDGLLATSVQSALLAQTGLENRGINRANFYVLKRTFMPSILVEMAFISNAAEEKKLLDINFQTKIAIGITQGLDKFFNDAAALNPGK